MTSKQLPGNGRQRSHRNLPHLASEYSGPDGHTRRAGPLDPAGVFDPEQDVGKDQGRRAIGEVFARLTIKSPKKMYGKIVQTYDINIQYGCFSQNTQFRGSG